MRSEDYYIAAIENNRNAFFSASAQRANRKQYFSDEFSWTSCAPSTWGNAVFSANFPEDEADMKIQKIIEQVKKSEMPAVWLTGPGTKPKDLGERLLTQGYQKVWEAAGMAMELPQLNGDFPGIDGLSFVPVEDEESLFAWSFLVVTDLFGGAADDTVHFYNLMKNFLDCPEVKFFAAYINGQIAATSSIFFHEGVAGIYHVTTRKDFRNLGVGRRITAAPLKFAKELGYETAILQASAMGQPVYEKLGFKEYSRLARYIYAPE